MYCTECGGQIEVQQKFCTACGTAVQVGNPPVGPPSGQIPQITTQLPPANVRARPHSHNILKYRVVFFLLYALLAIPTYILPYFGSNSSVFAAIGTLAGVGLMPQTWLHICCLVGLVLLAWLRGALARKGFIAIAPTMAAAADMLPGLNVIPLLPSFFHFVSVLLGLVFNPEDLAAMPPEAALVRLKESAFRTKMAAAAAGLLVILAGVQSALFFYRTNGPVQFGSSPMPSANSRPPVIGLVKNVNAMPESMGCGCSFKKNKKDRDFVFVSQFVGVTKPTDVAQYALMNIDGRDVLFSSLERDVAGDVRQYHGGDKEVLVKTLSSHLSRDGVEGTVDRVLIIVRAKSGQTEFQASGHCGC